MKTGLTPRPTNAWDHVEGRGAFPAANSCLELVAPGRARQREGLASPWTASSSIDKMEGPLQPTSLGSFPFLRKDSGTWTR